MIIYESRILLYLFGDDWDDYTQVESESNDT